MRSIYRQMDSQRHNRTYKKPLMENQTGEEAEENFKTLLEDSAREAYSRPWHRIERGLRLNRLRIFVEEIGPQYNMDLSERENFFIFLQKALDKKLLNTLKVVNYDPEDILKWGFNNKKPRSDGTRKKKRDDIPSVSTQISETKIESSDAQ